ncbi:type I restriction-modification system subunit M N-terminal domain-containing protein [Methylotenera mobilis]|uniref:type I restriction-modification system subunit M N-terminal domain-containing protein n=1 Tax=Methylotenera mobilis TaxID=359408 RepID=UPI0003999E8A|nr:type I restriction-modification system subunit M N-terminal domain-containing protein [Methylotenera mobilis]
MSEEQRRQLQQQLWNIANTLRGKMNADEFRDYILGFIFYKYLSEKIQRFGDSVLEADGLMFAVLNENTPEGAALVDAVHGSNQRSGILFKALRVIPCRCHERQQSA